MSEAFKAWSQRAAKAGGMQQQQQQEMQQQQQQQPQQQQMQSQRPPSVSLALADPRAWPALGTSSTSPPAPVASASGAGPSSFSPGGSGPALQPPPAAGSKQRAAWERAKAQGDKLRAAAAGSASANPSPPAMPMMFPQPSMPLSPLQMQQLFQQQQFMQQQRQMQMQMQYAGPPMMMQAPVMPLMPITPLPLYAQQLQQLSHLWQKQAMERQLHQISRQMGNAPRQQQQQQQHNGSAAAAAMVHAPGGPATLPFLSPSLLESWLQRNYSYSVHHTLPMHRLHAQCCSTFKQDISLADFLQLLGQISLRTLAQLHSTLGDEPFHAQSLLPLVGRTPQQQQMRREIALPADGMMQSQAVASVASPVEFDDDLPPDDLLFAPSAHTQYRRVWEDLLASELESPANAAACQSNRDGITITCADPLAKKSKTGANPPATMNADFAYVNIKAPQLLPPPRSGQQQQQQHDPMVNGSDGAQAADGEEKEEEQKQERSVADEVEEQQDAEEAAIAARYQNPLIDYAATAAPAANGDSSSYLTDDGAASSSQTNGASSSSSAFASSSNDDDEAAFKHLHLSASESSKHEACASTSAFWRWPHPPRRIFTVSNTHDFPLVLSVRFLALQRALARQFGLYTAAGTPLNERSRIVIEPNASAEVVVQAEASETIGLVCVFLLFDLEFPALWSRSASRARAAASSSPSIADSLLSFEVKHVTIVRALKALNVDRLAMRTLNREIKPFYPVQLKASFDEPALEIFAALPPSLPRSFTTLLEALEGFELPEGMDILHARRSSAVRISPEAAAHAAREFEEAWAQHVAGVKSRWIDARDHWDRMDDEDANQEEGGSQLDRFANNITSLRALHDSDFSAGHSAENLAMRARIRTHLCNMEIGLHAEELQMGLGVRSYDLFFTKLQPAPVLRGHPVSSAAASRVSPAQEFVVLTVPGVAERRPALAIGDRIELRMADRDPSLAVFAFVHSVRESEVLITFPLQQLLEHLGLFVDQSRVGIVAKPESDSDAAAAEAEQAAKLITARANFFRRHLWHVRFGYDRISFRLMYRSLHLLHASPHAARLLFPSRADALSPPYLAELPQIKPVDPNVNFEQLTVVQHVVARSHGLAPFIVFGPPGTGKTLTVVETILQLLRFYPAHSESAARILVVCPSNFAADVVVDRLSAHVSPAEMVRLNSFQRHTAVKPSVARYTYFEPGGEGSFGLPSIYELQQFRVIAMTCAMSALLLDSGVPIGAFSHIIYDESCQSLEAEALIPLALAGPQTSVVLAGDHLQLGAEVHSSVGASLGLKVSWQERLLRTDVYRESLAKTLGSATSAAFGSAALSSAASSASSSAPTPTVAVQLNKNYRSHPKLLAVSSALFYEGTLQPYASPALVNSLSNWESLPNQHNFPLLFLGVIGEDVFEESFSSFSNPLEAQAVVAVIRDLLGSRRVVGGVSTNDIGVIAPYRKQVLILRQLLRAAGLGAVRVGSVDDFQGLEEKIMVISTTVSRPRAGMFDAVAAGSEANESTVPLGILRNARRFNVALSRAKALTIVVGNPAMLAQEENWRDLLVYAMENGAYAGAPCALQKEVASKRMLGGAASQPHDSSASGEHALPIRASGIFGPRPPRSAAAAADQNEQDEEDDEWGPEVDPEDIVWEEGNAFFDGSWRVML